MRTLNGCACMVFAAGFLVVGVLFIVFGRQLGPSDSEAAAVFRTDPSCTAPLSATVPAGACTTSAVTIENAFLRESHRFTRTQTHTPFVDVRFADGTRRSGELNGRDGDFFATTVRPNVPGRAQLFRGTLVRVTAGGYSAETVDAPDAQARTSSQMPWAGAVLIAIGAAFSYGAMRSMRR